MSGKRWASFLASLVVTTIGLVWTLQGAGLLQGSVMSNDERWFAIGGVVAVLGGVGAYRTMPGRP